MIKVKDISGKLPRHTSKKYPPRSVARLTHFMVHHSATTDGREARNHARWHVNGRNWPGMAYDLFIHSVGRAERCHLLTEKGYHCGAGNMNTLAVALCVEGNWEVQIPSFALVQFAANVVAEEMHRIGRKLILTYHDEHLPRQCPGKHWPRELFADLVDARWDELNPVTPEPGPEDFDPIEDEETETQNPSTPTKGSDTPKTSDEKEPQPTEKEPSKREGCIGRLLALLLNLRD